MQPIYRNSTYVFGVTITVSDVAVDIRNDTVTAYISRPNNLNDVKLEKDADVATDGENGNALFELLTTDTTLEPGRYNLQVLWTLSGGTRKFLIADTAIDVKERSNP